MLGVRMLSAPLDPLSFQTPPFAVFCGPCSPDSLPLPGLGYEDSVRVCTTCHREVERGDGDVKRPPDDGGG